MKTLLFSGVFFLLIYVCMSSTCNTQHCTLDDLKQAYKEKVCKKEPRSQKNVQLYNGNVLRMKYHTLLYRNFLLCSNDDALLYEMNIENYRSKQLDGGNRESTKYILNYFYRTLHVVAKFKEIGTTNTDCTIENMYSRVMFDGANYDQHNRKVVDNDSLFVNINLNNIVNLNNITDNKHYELVDNILMDPSFDKNMTGNLFNSGADITEYGITTNIIFNDFFNYVINYPDTFGSWLNQTIFDFGNLDEEIEYNNPADSFINDTLNWYFDYLFNTLAEDTDLKIKHVYEFMDLIFVNRSIGFGVDLTGGSTFHVLNYVNDYKDKPIETQKVNSSVLNIQNIDVLNSSGTNFKYIKDQLTNQSAITERKKELSYQIIKKIIKSVTGKDYDKDSVIVEKNDKPNVLNRLKKYFFIHFFEKMGDSSTLQERIEKEIERTMEETIISLMVSSMYEEETPITFSLSNGEMNSEKFAIVLGLAKVCGKCYSKEGYDYLDLNPVEKFFANSIRSDFENFLEFTDVCKVNQCSKDLFSNFVYKQNWYVSGGINTLLLTFVNKLISDDNYKVMLPDEGLTVTNLNATFKSLIPIDNVTSPQGQKYDAYLNGVGEGRSPTDTSSFGIIWGILTLSIGQHQSRYECARDCSFTHPTLPVDCKLLSKKCTDDTNTVFSIDSRDDTFDIDIKHSLHLGS